LKVFAGKYDEAIQLMTMRTFSVWEGGTVEVVDHWVNAHLLRGQRELAAKQYAAALADFEAAATIPDNLPSDRATAHEAEIAYWTGVAQEAAGNVEQAQQAWQRAASIAPARRGRRNADGASRLSDFSVQVYFQALAQRKLGRIAEANETLKALLDTANRELERGDAVTDTPESQAERPRSSRNRSLQAHYVAGLAYLGLGETEKARQEFTQVLQQKPDSLGAKTALAGF
jgi:tetratricopeptide (TPR) repeat protein